LVITPAEVGWRVLDLEQRLPPSIYDAIEEAKHDAREYVAHHGGGRVVVREGAAIVWVADVESAT
jgi:hypothetical protein